MIEQLLFWVFAILSCGGAIAVVATQNVVRMAFWLVVSLGSVAALFFLLHADFLGAAQLLIYVGGTVVLLVFGVMLTASGPYVRIRTSPAEMLLGVGAGGLLLYVMVSSISKVDFSELSVRIPIKSGSVSVSEATRDSQRLQEAAAVSPGSDAGLDQQLQQGQTVRPLGLSFLGLRPDRNLKARGPNGGLAPGYFLPFEIVSIHLLVVLIGAAYLARAKRRIAPAGSGEIG